MLRPRVSTHSSNSHTSSRAIFPRRSYFGPITFLGSYFSGSSIQPSHASQLEKISGSFSQISVDHADQIRLTEIRFIRTTFNLHSSSSEPYHFRGNFLQLTDELYCTWDAREKSATALDGISIAPPVSSSEANKHRCKQYFSEGGIYEK